MTRPKFRPCPSCQTLNAASLKTCSMCYVSLSMKKKLKEKTASLDSKWGQGIVPNRNVGRIIDSARIAVRKLEAIGYKPILFMGKKDKKASNKWVADIITHLPLTSTTKNFLEKMRRAYEFLLTKEQQPNTDPSAEPDNPTMEQGDSPVEGMGHSQDEEQHSSLAMEQRDHT
ncbi:hypothetical protein JOB18_037962 [Solea senegalensis]|uniref:Uncharacterized protein n=2 Tax=Solea senegalensis TaxID=28829 RepID=A0AAV6PGC5_SOLSE|nr:hypothetical protein JOB18_037962 [Solea senegalensis]KAG7458319.1 hypothetical protein JOB18_037962 [Solea senegalensis]KAG7458320.1 hypothetical protein JOB18_037962 [Solea senegalensis]